VRWPWTDLDERDLTDPGGLLDRLMASVKPWCVFIDTLTSATSLDLCDQRVMKGLKTPLLRLAQHYGVNVCLMLHLSREGQALGRRIKGITRTLMHLECPDPEHSPGRLRFWVEKSYAEKPPALGVTLGSNGNAYDFNPPGRAEPRAGGRPREPREKAMQFVRDALTRENDRTGNALRAEWEKTGGCERTFWRGVDDLAEASELTKDGGTGTGRQVVLHLSRPGPGPDRPH
jgi:hypothetical protein